ncbi:MAG: helix-turn-helix domain-containing protein [Gammaproteobacteria bacterium]|nr:helix-turn-helix domain-containing protein [Gammaproteobacteria bacterium]
MVEDRWLPAGDTALYLGMKRDTVYRWSDRKQTPGRKVGRLWKFRREAVDEWVRAGSAAKAASRAEG